MAISDMWFDSMWASDPQGTGNSVSTTINLDAPANAAAQISLSGAAYFGTPGWDQCYIIEYSSNGNPVDVSNQNPEFLLITDATSFTFKADTYQGVVTALMNVFLFS